MQNRISDTTATVGRPIGVFDSGIGGLTVAREIARRLPHESILYLGDTLRCPYGPRPLAEIKGYARQISSWLAGQDVKLVVIACNSATAAALECIQQESPVPVIGVVEPGARAAVLSTLARRVGVIGTAATIDSGIYARAIRSLDAGITTFSAATPRFVEMVEQGLRLDRNPFEDIMAHTSAIYIRPAFLEIARDYLEPLKRCRIDTLVLGCTHYPLLAPLLSQVVGPEVCIISSAEETAREVEEVLARRGQLVPDARAPKHRFATTAADTEEFAALGAAILAHPMSRVQTVAIAELEDALARFEEGLARAERALEEAPGEASARAEGAPVQAGEDLARSEGGRPSVTLLPFGQEGGGYHVDDARERP